jgi:micrococcal nuclease
MYEYRAKVISIYDGDTLTAEVDLGFNIKITEKFRLSGLNAPELRGEERGDGLISRDKLRDKILGKKVVIKTFKDITEKYGRYIAEIYLEKENINEWLISEGLVKRKKY